MKMLETHRTGSGLNAQMEVTALDEPDHDIGGGARHRYLIEAKGAKAFRDSPFARISFQHGPPPKGHGPNGCTVESILAILIDRLQHFQAGKFRCRHNALALTKLEEAMHWLHARTQDRTSRGVEGEQKQ